jgi:hypothetical protein
MLVWPIPANDTLPHPAENSQIAAVAGKERFSPPSLANKKNLTAKPPPRILIPRLPLPRKKVGGGAQPIDSS